MTGTAPRVTQEQVDASIVGETYTVLPDGKTTICQLTLYNGFTVDGHSACVCKENFDEAEGKKWSRLQAVNKIWPLLGFLLANDLYLATLPTTEPVLVTPEGEGIAPLGMGDQVHYFERLGDNITEPMLAIVAKAVGPDELNLTVHAPNGTVHARQSAMLLGPGVEPPAHVTYFARRKEHAA